MACKQLINFLSDLDHNTICLQNILYFESGINGIYDSTIKFILKPFCP